MPLPPPKVAFLLPVKDAELERLREYDPDRDSAIFSTGLLIWTLQTYLRLRNAGFPVELAALPPTRGIAVVHADLYNWLLQAKAPASDLHIVAMRADRYANPGADSEIVQNLHSADGRRSRFIAHWPQPGLQPRDPTRGSRLTVATFKGYVQSMHPYFGTPECEQALARIGVQWRQPRTHFINQFVANATTDWHDYESIDAVVGLRPDLASVYPEKPASKLVNAWRAGVPAILGPEIAYRELRRGELDFIEVASAPDVVGALDHLRRSPDVYRAMVENGHERARQFSMDSVVQEWTHLLDSLLGDFDSPAAMQARREIATRRATTPYRAAQGRPARR